jgi:hypothetical protein
MSRLSLPIALALTLASSGSWAYEPTGPMNSISSAGINDGKTVDVSRPTVADPAAVDLLFKEGNTLASVLEGLKEKGFHIQYKKKQVPPTMTLVSLPKGDRIDEVLHEILEPWNLDAYHSPSGQWIVRPSKTKTAQMSGTE